MHEKRRFKLSKIPKTNAGSRFDVVISTPVVITVIFTLATVLMLVFLFVSPEPEYEFSFFVKETGEKIEGEVFLNDRFLGYASDGNFSIARSELYPGVISLKGAYKGRKFGYTWNLTKENIANFSGMRLYVTEDYAPESFSDQIYQVHLEKKFNSDLARREFKFTELYPPLKIPALYDPSFELGHEGVTLHVNFNSSGPASLYLVEGKDEFRRYSENAFSYLMREMRIRNYSGCVDAFPGYGLVVFNSYDRTIEYGLETRYVRKGEPCPAK